MKRFTPSLHPCYSWKMFHEPQCEDLTVLVWLWRQPTYTCCQWKVNTDSEARGPLTESPPLTPVLSSVFLGNLLPQFGFNPTHLEGESNFTGPRGVTPSQSYLFPNDLTQQVDHISFGGLAEDSWVGNIEPEWIKYGCQEKNLKWSLRT